MTQYDLKGKRIARYPSLQDAEEATGANSNAIRLVMKGDYKSAKGYFWKKGYGKPFIDLSGYKSGHDSMAVTQSKKIKQYSQDGKIIQTFNSIKEAAAFIGVNSYTLTGACKGYQNTCKGFRWRYADQ